MAAAVAQPLILTGVQSTFEFGLAGVQYAMDLSEDNAAGFRGVLNSYTSHGKRTRGRKRRVAPAKTNESVGESHTADGNGSTRSGNGQEAGHGGLRPRRIPAEIVESDNTA